jgi:Spy/CpxP family protein refolding chaperone
LKNIFSKSELQFAEMRQNIMKGEIAMKKTAQTFYWTALLTVALLLVPAFAQDNPKTGEQAGDKESRYEATLNQLNLTAEQKEKIKAQRQNQKQQMKALRQSLKEARAKLKEQLDKPEATRESITPLADNIKNIMAKMVDQRVEGIFAIKSLLTAEQFSQLQAWQKNRQEERGSRPFWLGKKRANKEKTDQEE